jgi:hypothetical protein
MDQRSKKEKLRTIWRGLYASFIPATIGSPRRHRRASAHCDQSQNIRDFRTRFMVHLLCNQLGGAVCGFAFGTPFVHPDGQLDI